MSSYSAGRGDDHAPERPIHGRDDVPRASLEALRRFGRREELMQDARGRPRTIITVTMGSRLVWKWNEGVGLYERAA